MNQCIYIRSSSDCRPPDVSLTRNKKAHTLKAPSRASSTVHKMVIGTHCTPSVITAAIFVVLHIFTHVLSHLFKVTREMPPWVSENRNERGSLCGPHRPFRRTGRRSPFYLEQGVRSSGRALILNVRNAEFHFIYWRASWSPQCSTVFLFTSIV